MRIEAAGRRVLSILFQVANKGPWYADLDFEGPEEVSGKITITVGKLSLVGTVVPDQSGVFAGRFKARVVAGGAGWSSVIDAKPYHSDAGIKGDLIVRDAARAAGETLGEYAGVPTIGISYLRGRAPASSVFEDTAKALPWYVDYSGVTQVASRAAHTPNPDDVQIADYDSRSRIATLNIQDPSDVVIGSVLSDSRLGTSQTIRELAINISDDGFTCKAWCGGNETSNARLVDVLGKLARHAQGNRLYGIYRYRVYRMSGDRVECQVVDKAPGLPDVVPVSMWPGTPGQHSVLTEGAEVLIQFVNGERSRAVLTQFGGKGAPGHKPQSISYGDAPANVARQGDGVTSMIGPMVFAGTINGLPASGVVSPTLPTVLGTIDTGSPLFKVGT